ncbi:MAG: glycyl radical protein [Bacteroidales bacterium]|nr:glycyl radical protein [Bacteroidales bacterium]
MNRRITKLHSESKKTMPFISHERAVLLTRFYNSGQAGGQSIPVQRALAFKYLLENKTLYLGEGELIVGERGPSPQATPTYPEICLHSEEDLNILHDREKIPFKVGKEVRKVYVSDIRPFWTGKTIRERIFREAPQSWKDAYEAGIFTEFLEQRAPGHTVLDDKIYRKGMLDFIAETDKKLQDLDFIYDPDAPAKKAQLTAMKIAAKALILFAARYAEMIGQKAENETDPIRKKELMDMAAVCRHVPGNKPRTFHEALQYYWFVHIGVITELNPWDSFNPGRIDQHLYPFFKKETKEGTLSVERAKELLQAFWVKFNNHPAPPKVGVTAKESNTYTDFALLNLGGVTTEGRDAVNDLTFLILDVIEEMRLLQPSSMIQVSKKNPDAFIRRALRIIKTGYGQPSVFNTDVIIQELLRQGKTIEDARNGGASGCVETGAFGKEAYILTGYFNIPKALEITLNNGTDPRTGKLIGLQTGNPSECNDFDSLLVAFSKQIRHFINIKITGNNIIGDIYARYMPAPFLSLLIDDCIENARDYNAGGARYNTSYIQGVGMGSITDELAALKFHVFDRKSISMNEFLDALANNFRDHEEFRQILLNETPKYGNDDDYADDILKQVFEIYYSAVDGKPAARGGLHRINLLPTTCHVYFGSVTGAMPDGRKAGKPLSEGISPVQGADRQGPTAVIKSASKIDHLRTGGTLLNQKFTPSIFESDSGIEGIKNLIRTYFRLDGHHIQFNVIEAETLRKAKKEPENYRDLIVRVAGYSDYFTHLTEELQDEIIARTEHRETAG